MSNNHRNRASLFQELLFPDTGMKEVGMVSQRQQEYRLRELGDFLRTRRARLTPEEVGLLRGSRRKTPGLRRAEVAQLVGVSVDWYTWLEQGRSITPSTQVLERLNTCAVLHDHALPHFLLRNKHR
ncbi:helix-turn-helix domain-containing protein [Ktedonosporobacter rubrisoli]|uniref:helix-turn-helix domain-containing protein n=1 Tax=Ktedonosporobacter rubrisoli TaxID=2509675 RepID=UPI0026BB03B0